MPEFPFHPDLYSFSSYRTLTVNDAVFIFGGWGNGLPLADVAKFENNVWYKMTDMLRRDFQIILNIFRKFEFSDLRFSKILVQNFSKFGLKSLF